MSELTERITKVLQEHQVRLNLHHTDGSESWHCVCGCVSATGQGQFAHVAAAVEAAISKPPHVDDIAEAMADADDGIIFGLLTPDEAEFYRRMARAALRLSSWVESS